MLKPRNKKKVKILVILVVILIGFLLAAKVFNISSVLFQVIFNNKIELKKDEERVNLLLLGIGGGKHEGPNLTDTIILATIDPKRQKVTLVSIPRDLWSYELKGKVNSAYAKGEDQRDGGGLVLAKNVVSKITGQSVDYAVVIDFAGFVKAVDLVGGIDVDVQRTFDDFEYPVEGNENDTCGRLEEEIPLLSTASSQLKAFPCRYQHLHFDQGLNHMDGETALRFVRSRHATGAEGTDFARSQRQEKVINSLKDRVLSLNILLNPTKMIGLYDTVKESIKTDIKNEEFDDFIKLAQKVGEAQIKSAVIDSGNQDDQRRGLLFHPSISSQYNYEWVLIPRTGRNDFSEIHSYIECVIERDDCEAVKQIID